MFIRVHSWTQEKLLSTVQYRAGSMREQLRRVNKSTLLYTRKIWSTLQYIIDYIRLYPGQNSGNMYISI
jgi:hypothetical protein